MSVSLDSALDPMEEIRFRKKHGALWMEIQKETHFTFDELEPGSAVCEIGLWMMYKHPVIFSSALSKPPVKRGQYRNNSPMTLKTMKEAYVPQWTWTAVLGLHVPSATMLRQSDPFTPNDFNFTEVMVIFFKIQKRDEKPAASDLISRVHFRDVLHTGLGMTDAYMMERVMVALDRGTSPSVTMATFAKAMSLYLRGSLEERIQYAFTCYDLLGEGALRRETMYQCLKKSLVKVSRDDDVEEAVKEFVDIMLKRMDRDIDGVINYTDFRDSVVTTPSLLESLGYCLPERPAVYAFLATWCPSWGRM